MKCYWPLTILKSHEVGNYIHMLDRVNLLKDKVSYFNKFVLCGVFFCVFTRVIRLNTRKPMHTYLYVYIIS